jgi:hypothetical protein
VRQPRALRVLLAMTRNRAVWRSSQNEAQTMMPSERQCTGLQASASRLSMPANQATYLTRHYALYCRVQSISGSVSASVEAPAVTATDQPAWMVDFNNTCLKWHPGMQPVPERPALQADRLPSPVWRPRTPARDRRSSKRALCRPRCCWQLLSARRSPDSIRQPEPDPIRAQLGACPADTAVCVAVDGMRTAHPVTRTGCPVDPSRSCSSAARTPAPGFARDRCSNTAWIVAAISVDAQQTP